MTALSSAPESPADLILLDARLATLVPGAVPYGAIPDGAVVVRDGRIVWVGPRAELSRDVLTTARTVRRLDGRWVTPGLIDCHTHLVFGGDRAQEFEQRLQGVSYEDISRAGGGILSTVRATRAADEEDLLAQAQPRLEGLRRDGVTTVEIKSGYGLNLETERKQLSAARTLGRRGGVRVVTTYLALHALPPEYHDDRSAFVDRVIAQDLPAMARSGLVDAVDAFCENIAFTPQEVARLFTAAQALGLPVKLHADQLSDGGGAALAARFGALSADHVEYADEAGVAAMAQAGTVAVLLPGAFLMLRETKVPPVEALRRAGVAMAVASDCNPGTSPMPSLLAALCLACAQFRLTPEEALAGATRNAARALGLGHEIGTLAPGLAADLAVWDIDHPAELAYWLGKPLLHEASVAGRPRRAASPVAVATGVPERRRRPGLGRPAAAPPLSPSGAPRGDTPT
jgi:imidazolonepropionase